jgi:anti-sigma-K factor RskA
MNMTAHPTREEDFDLYALGALEGEEKQAIETHLASCAACAAKLAEARGRLALLALAAPSAAPSPAVKQRVMRQIHVEAPSAAPAVSRATAPDSEPPGFFARWWLAVLAPAGIVLAAATIILWRENRLLDQQLAGLRASARQQQQLLAEAREATDFVTSHDTITVSLAPQPGMPQGAAHVMYNAKMGMLMYDGEIAPAPAAKSYQLWLVPEQGKPISAGVFNSVSGQPNHWMMKLSPGIAPKEFAVSLEPSGGMPQPTGPMVLIGPVS